jgi:hypothetical protein
MYEELKEPVHVEREPEPAMIPVMVNAKVSVCLSTPVFVDCCPSCMQDDLTTTLVQQCQQCQHTIQRIVGIEHP